VLTKERSHTLSATKGSLCLFGSTEFVAQFQAHWQRDGYCDYTLPPQAAALSGTHVSASNLSFLPTLFPYSLVCSPAYLAENLCWRCMLSWTLCSSPHLLVRVADVLLRVCLPGLQMLRKVVGEAQEALEGAAASGAGGTPSRARTASNMSVDSQSQAPHTSASSGAGSSGGGRHHTPTRHHPSGGSAWGMQGGGGRTAYVVPGPPEVSVTRPEYPVAIEAADLTALLKKRPELVEFLSLEIAAMKVETGRLINLE
jgi:hypothetical protein